MQRRRISFIKVERRDWQSSLARRSHPCSHPLEYTHPSHRDTTRRSCLPTCARHGRQTPPPQLQMAGPVSIVVGTRRASARGPVGCPCARPPNRLCSSTALAVFPVPSLTTSRCCETRPSCLAALASASGASRSKARPGAATRPRRGHDVLLAAMCLDGSLYDWTHCPVLARLLLSLSSRQCLSSPRTRPVAAHVGCLGCLGCLACLAAILPLLGAGRGAPT